ncbi:MAG: enoyl-CoA hydratase/isomerase family protein [Methylobacteriaceae bacterium]|nr:enoyl-CoA hydratase/isomerase family protein [Methylobacteriaceae bacterium]
MSDHVEIVRDGARLEIHLNRPDKKNALTGAMYAAVAEGLASAEREPGVLAVILAGRGQAFCAGNDLADFMANPPSGDDSPVARFLRAISTATKAVVAAVQGPAVGVGATMLLHCDHVVASEEASLQFPFARLALVPEAASSLLLPRVVGPLAAAELMLTGDPLPAAEAKRLGLVSRVVPSGEALAGARAFAARLEGLPPEALRETKRLLRATSQDVATRMAEENALFRRQLGSAEFAEAARAFLEKRKPVFAR